MLEKIPDMASDPDTRLENLASIIAKEVRAVEGVTTEQKREIFSLIRKWTEYAKERGIDQSDMLSVRYHLLEFSERHFGQQGIEYDEAVELHRMPIDTLEFPDGTSFTHYINRGFGEGANIFNDEHVAIYGGISRLALKLYALKNDRAYDSDLIDAELPVNDVDIVIDDKNVGNRYGSGVAGTRVVGNLEEYARNFYRTTDCTINQTLICRGELLFTEDALRDNRTGELRFIEKEETLFDPDSVILEDGKMFVTEKGFYRALIYLLRHKAQRLSLHKENLEFLGGSTYVWARPLPKILALQDTVTRNRSVNEWFSLAKSLGVTDSSGPEGFLKEIISENPDIVKYDFKKDDMAAAEIRWIIHQFLKSGVRSVIPDQYPKGMSEESVAIDMKALRVEESDLTAFFETINQTFDNAKFSAI